MTKMWFKNILILVLTLCISSYVQANETTVIIGMGPSGLLSAYHQLKLGHQVTIIEERENPVTRNRQILLTRKFLTHIIQSFTNYAANGYTIKFGSLAKNDCSLNITVDRSKIDPIDLEFFDQVAQHNMVISIKALQEYLLTKMHSQFSDQQLHIIKPATILAVDTANGNIILENQQQPLPFQNLIIAEGSRRQVTSMLFATEDHGLTTYPLPIPRSQHKTYGVMKVAAINLTPTMQAAINTRPIIAPIVNESSRMTTEHLPSLQANGWHKNYLPINLLQYIYGDQQFYIASEIPDSWAELAEEDFKATFLKFATNILKIEYPGLSTTTMQLVEEHAVFSLQPTFIEKSYLDLGNNRRVFVIGDALMSSNLLIGNGIQNTATSAYVVAKCFDANGNFLSPKKAIALLKELKMDYLKRNARCKMLFYLNRHPLQKRLFVKISNILR